MVGYLRAGSVQLVSGLTLRLVGTGGNLLGSLLSRMVPNHVLLLAFSALILAAAWRMYKRHTETPCHAKQLVQAMSGDGRDQPATGATSTSSASTASARPDTTSRAKVAVSGGRWPRWPGGW
nr:sulfite exporter TauE/SafE family protein [Candidatus Mycobacterium methanotrophicum]